MKTLLLTTMLVSALTAAPLLAQTADPAAPADTATMPDIAAPEGFVRQDIVLTAEDLLGATIYDATGESIGDVHDLVLDIGASGGGGTTGAMPEAGGATGTDDTTGSASDGATTGTGTDNGADAGVGGATDKAPADGSSDGMADSATVPETGGATDTTPATGGDTATGAATTDGTTTGADMAGSAGASSPAGRATHAVLDIGGFLGMGEHRVAVPISDLAIYRSGSETRVYLPWSRAQLEALPVYSKDDPASLGRSAMPAAN